MAHTIRKHAATEKTATPYKRQRRTQLLKEFEADYRARNQSPYIEL